MTGANRSLLKNSLDPTPGRRPVTWDGGAAMVVDEDKAFGAFSTIPSEHYIQIALGTGGGRHVVGWNGRHVFDGDYKDGLMSVTPAGHTLHGECQASWRRALIVRVKPRFVARVSQDAGFAHDTIIPAIDQTDTLLWQLANAVAAECEAGVPNRTLYAETAATLLSLHLLRHNAGLAPVRPQPVRGGLAPYVLRRVTELIEFRLGEDISLSELAGLADLSVSHFCRAFKVSTGRSPHQWRAERRIERAKEMLCYDRMTIAEIALACGFSSQSHFGSVFISSVGVSPAAWRRLQLS